MTIPGDSLPAPSFVSTRTDYNRAVSPIGGMVFTHRSDSAVNAQRYQLNWAEASPEVVDACLLHYETHGLATFKWTAPKETVQKTWRWMSAPTVTFTTARSASIVGELERVLAFVP